MAHELDTRELQSQNEGFRGTGGISQENRGAGFRPAFLDRDTGAIYGACFADGQPAPFHLLDGLPPAVVRERSPCGRVLSVKASVVAGFLREGRFFTRTEAADALALH